MACRHLLLIHADGTATCFTPGCLDRLTTEQAVRRHRHVVSCRRVLATQCPWCYPVGGGDQHVPPSAATPTADSVCPGVVVVHSDLSVECSAPGCRKDMARGAWFARHDEILACSDLMAGCLLCAVVDDRG